MGNVPQNIPFHIKLVLEELKSQVPAMHQQYSLKQMSVVSDNWRAERTTSSSYDKHLDIYIAISIPFK